eukprot:s384_g2.t1
MWRSAMGGGPNSAGRVIRRIEPPHSQTATLVVQIGHHMLRYLDGSKHLCLVSHPMKDADDDEWHELKVLADTSFASPHEKLRSMQAVVVERGTNILAWQSARQAFTTQSTAEAELVGYSEALQIGQATSALLDVLEIFTTKSVVGDSKAALAQLLGDTGPWRGHGTFVCDRQL